MRLSSEIKINYNDPAAIIQRLFQINKINLRHFTQHMKKSGILATVSLLITAVIWGLSYSAQAEAMNTMKPLFFVINLGFRGVFL